jgi:hypothetical protein
VLLVVSAAAAWIVTRLAHQNQTTTAIAVITSGGGLPALYLSWRQLVAARTGKVNPKKLADELAGVMQDQWADEAMMRQQHDRVPLEVSWKAADPELSASWRQIVAMTRHAGWPPEPAPGTWAEGPEGLAGEGHNVTRVLRQVPTGRLVVLGQPGSGKTMLMVRLARDLLRDRQAGEPVPVLVSVASWRPVQPDRDGRQRRWRPGRRRTSAEEAAEPEPELPPLRDFLESEICLAYPELSAPVRTAAMGRQTSGIRALLESGLITPILDGLDEIPAGNREQAFHKIDEMLDRPGSLLVTCRAADYASTVRPPGKAPRPLRGAAVVEMLPLRMRDIRDYLTDADADDRWERVLAQVADPALPLGQALRTPLFVTLALAIYTDTSGRPKQDGRGPGELCDFGTAEHLEDYLFDAFISSAFRKDPRPDALNWPAKDAEAWIRTLAEYLEPDPGRPEPASGVDAQEAPDPTRNLQWWTIRNHAPSWLGPAVAGGICAIASGVAAALGTHVGVGIGVGFGTGMAVALAIGLGMRRLTHFTGKRPGPGMAGALTGAVVGGIVAGLAHKAGFGYEHSLFSGLPEGLGIGLGGGASTNFRGGLLGGLVGSFIAGVLEGVWLGLPAGIINGLGVGLAVALAIRYVGRDEPARQQPEWRPEIGLPGGVVIGLAVGLICWREAGLPFGLGVGAAIGALASWPFGLRDTAQKLQVVSTPRSAMTRDVRAFRITALAAGIASAAAGFVGGSLSSISEIGATASLHAVVADGLGIGLSSGLVVGVTFGFYHAASPTFALSSAWLAWKGKLPWRLMSFLSEAHRRGVLRQYGAAYQFRHELLRAHLVEHARGAAEHPQVPTRMIRLPGRTRQAAPETPA